jgi:LmbE family N-acetylglucosaminyl deacetylase
MSDTVLVVAAHPDDEALGMGGTLARLSAAGVACHCLFLTDGVSARGAGRSAEATARHAAAEEAAAILGLTSIRFLNFPDNRLDTVPRLEVVQAIEVMLAETAADTLYTHHEGDLNIDHRIARIAALTASRPLPDRPIRAIHAFEVPSSSEWHPGSAEGFVPNKFVAIDTAVKLAALDAYAAEMRPFPHPRSPEAIDALARWRGATVGLPAAEGFQVLREIDR